MIEHLERVVPEAGERPDTNPMADTMQATTREIAFEPGSWTKERAAKVASLFDSIAPMWSSRASELRHDAAKDAMARGGPFASELALEVGSGTGIFTPMLSEHLERLVAVDISHEMLRLAPADLAPRVQADASCLPVADGSVATIVLINCFLFPAEVDRVLEPDGALVWVSTLARQTPIYLDAADVERALPGSWSGVASDAGWGSWSVFRRTR